MKWAPVELQVKQLWYHPRSLLSPIWYNNLFFTFLYNFTNFISSPKRFHFTQFWRKNKLKNKKSKCMHIQHWMWKRKLVCFHILQCTISIGDEDIYLVHFYVCLPLVSLLFHISKVFFPKLPLVSYKCFPGCNGILKDTELIIEWMLLFHDYHCNYS